MTWEPGPCVCGHIEREHRSIPRHHCQNGMAEGLALCECPSFLPADVAAEMQREEDERAAEAQAYEDYADRQADIRRSLP